MVKAICVIRKFEIKAINIGAELRGGVEVVRAVLHKLKLLPEYHLITQR